LGLKKKNGYDRSRPKKTKTVSKLDIQDLHLVLSPVWGTRHRGSNGIRINKRLKKVRGSGRKERMLEGGGGDGGGTLRQRKAIKKRCHEWFQRMGKKLKRETGQGNGKTGSLSGRADAPGTRCNGQKKRARKRRKKKATSCARGGKHAQEKVQGGGGKVRGGNQVQVHQTNLRETSFSRLKTKVGKKGHGEGPKHTHLENLGVQKWKRGVKKGKSTSSENKKHTIQAQRKK